MEGTFASSWDGDVREGDDGDCDANSAGDSDDGAPKCERSPGIKQGDGDQERPQVLNVDSSPSHTTVSVVLFVESRRDPPLHGLASAHISPTRG